MGASEVFKNQSFKSQLYRAVLALLGQQCKKASTMLFRKVGVHCSISPLEVAQRDMYDCPNLYIKPQTFTYPSGVALV
jgi:hypothetical protein